MRDEDLVRVGDRVLLYLDSRRTWLVQVNENSQTFHTHAGIVDLKSVIGKIYGDSIQTTMNETIRILKPTAVDYIMKSERRTQIVYPKDFSYIVTRSGIRSGSKVLECGTGSGALTTFFASLVTPEGWVRTYEERNDFFEIARKNIAKAGMSQYVRMENVNLLQAAGLEEASYDLVMLDTGDPWLLLDRAHYALRGSGFVFCICPTTNQLEVVAESLKRGFVDIESVEIMLRRIEARSGKTRPSTRMIGHTCFLCSARKVNSAI